MLANDPDADRLAAAVPDSSGSGYRMLSGNEIGVLLADDALEHADTGGRPKLVVTTVVSSSLLSRMAHDRGAQYRETLTGFKWIADTAIRAERDGDRVRDGLRGGARLLGRAAGARQGRDRGRRCGSPR